MSEYELADLAASTMSNFLTSFTIFVSIVTAYVIAAFVAGERLSKIQVAIVNACFLIAGGAIGLLSVLAFQVFLRRVRKMAEVAEAVASGGIVIDVTWAVATLYVVLVCGSLSFMWNVRHPPTSE